MSVVLRLPCLQVVIGITVSVTALLEQRFGVLVVGDIPIG